MKNIFSDRELWFILAFNLVLAIGFYFGVFSMDTLVWIFFFQSILIGIGNTVRIALLKNFNTDNFHINGEAVNASNSTKRFSALFFTFHYNFFHFVYAIFLTVSSVGNGSKLDFRLLWINVILMAGNTLISTWSNIIEDRTRKPGIAGLFFTPYLRVVPMHLFIMIGFTMKTSKVFMGMSLTHENLFWIFLILKIFSDSAMHIVIQKSWRAKRIQPIPSYV